MKKIIAILATLVVAFGLSLTVATTTGATAAECTPQAAYSEVVVDHEAYDTTETYTQHYSLKGNSGIGKDEVPVFPADYWQANTEQEPNGHYNTAQKPDGSEYVEGDSGLHYVSAGSSGNRDWFYFGEDTVTVHHDAVTHTVDHPAVTCDGDKPDVKPTPTTELGPVPTKKPKDEVVIPTVVHAGL